MKNVGAGEQEITGLEEGKSIDYKIRFFIRCKIPAKQISKLGYRK
jgi:hypothetical protein